MPAVVLGEVGLVRSLGEAGIPCVVVACRKEHLAFASRYCKESIVVPSFDPDCKETLDRLLEVGRRLGKSTLFCNGEPDFLFISKNRQRLAPYFLFNIPSEKQADLLVDKGKFYRMAAEYGLPIPQTWQPDGLAALKAVLHEITYPCIVKPSQQSFWKGASFQEKFGEGMKAIQADTPEALYSLYKELVVFHSDILIQEYIPGRDDRLYFFDAYLNEHSEPLGHFIGHRIRTYPIHCGISSLAETVHDLEMVRVALRALQQIQYRGGVHIDIKIDDRDGSIRILEINPRFGLAIDLGARAGMNLPAIAYHSLLGRTVHPAQAYVAGLKWIDTKHDLKALLGYLKTGEWNIPSYLRSFQGSRMFRMWDRNDPWPAVLSSGRFVKNQFKKAFRKLNGKRSSMTVSALLSEITSLF